MRSDAAREIILCGSMCAPSVHSPSLAAHAHGSLLGGQPYRNGTVAKISRICDEVVWTELPSVAGYRWTNRSYSLLESTRDY